MTTLRSGALVLPVSDLAGVHTPEGELVPSERLGPGLVEELTADDIYVHWLDAELDTWVAREDVRPVGSGTRLVNVRRCDRKGRCTLQRRRLVPALDHHWTVDLLPNGVIRSIRPDGWCWTFTFNPLRRQVEPPWLTPITDDAAEAIVAADLATEDPPAPWRALWHLFTARLWPLRSAAHGNSV